MNQPETPRARLRAFLDHRRGTLARLRRVNEALSHWDEYEAAAAMPATLRPVVERPTLGRQTLKELQRTPSSEHALRRRAIELAGKAGWGPLRPGSGHPQTAH